MPRMYGDIDFWNLPSRDTIGFAFRRYGLRVFLLLAALRLLWILLAVVSK